MGKEVEVKILGNKYSFITDKDVEEAKNIASYVDNLLQKAKEEDPYLSELEIAIITALNIADSYFELTSEIEKLEKYVSKE